MKDPKIPKFSWGKNFEYNCGHSKNEWGITCEEDNEEPSVKFIIAYTIKGGLANLDTHGFLTSH